MFDSSQAQHEDAPPQSADDSEEEVYDHFGLEIIGRSCYIHDDAALALQLDTEAHLIPWRDKTCDTMDRFDCRLLLDSYADASMGVLSYEAAPDEEEATCNAFRYRGIVLDEDGCDSNRLESASDDDDKTASENVRAATEIKCQGGEAEDPSWLSVPSCIAYTPPYFTASCARRPLLRISHVIISRTARLVALCGARIDTMLRIRHGALPCFRFLFSDSDLRPYFDAMVEVKMRRTYHTSRHTSHAIPFSTTRATLPGTTQTTPTEAIVFGPAIY
jgi:hypothetical protein